MTFLLQPLIEEDDNEHRRHNKAYSRCVKFEKRADKSADGRARNPVKAVEPCDKEHEPALVHILRDFCRVVYGKALVAHTVDERKLFPAGALEFIEHGDTVKQVASLNEQRHEKNLQRRKRAEQHLNGDKFKRTAEDKKAHQHRVDKGKAQCVHIDSVGQPQKPEARKYRDGVGKGCLQRAQPCSILVFHFYVL